METPSVRASSVGPEHSWVFGWVVSSFVLSGPHLPSWHGFGWRLTFIVLYSMAGDADGQMRIKLTISFSTLRNVEVNIPAPCNSRPSRIVLCVDEGCQRSQKFESAHECLGHAYVWVAILHHQAPARGPPTSLYDWFLLSSASRLVIARVYGFTNEVQKRYMTKCIGDISIS